MKIRQSFAAALLWLIALAMPAAAQSIGYVGNGQIGANYGSGYVANNWMASGSASCPAWLSSAELYLNTSGGPTGDLLQIFDGTSCVTIGTLNATAHSFTVGAAQGGTGLNSPTAHSLLQAEGSSAFGVITAATAGNIPVDQGSGSDWISRALSGDATLAASGALTVTKTNGTAFGPFATLASPTANVLYKGNGASTPQASALSDNGTIVSSSRSIDLTSNAAVIEVANAASTGTTVNKLAKLTGSPSTAVIATTSDTGGVVAGIVIGGAGTTGNAQIAVQGQASCIFSGGVTAGDFVQVSTATGGDCVDAGATLPTTGGQIIGRVVSATNASAGTYTVALNGPGVQATSASSSGTVTEQKNTASGGLTTSGNCDNTTTNASSPCNYALALSGATLQQSPTAPTGTSSTTPVMEGLGKDQAGSGAHPCTLTPVNSTRVFIQFTGEVFNNTSGDYSQVHAAYGTGTAPSTGASATGTQIGVSSLYTSVSANQIGSMGTVGGVITGLTIGTAYWFDLALNASAGTAAINIVSCSAYEIY